jgi:hypothetical protein
MALNKGTLVASPVRPVDNSDRYPSALSNEVQGGLHSVQDQTERDAIPYERRNWGMLCYVIDDLKLYQLQYNHVNTTIYDNLNWTEFKGGGGTGTEWIDSVISTVLTEPASPNIGDRYLLGKLTIDTPTGANWGGQTPTQVAEWNGSIWDYTTPTENMSVRIDDENNAIWRFEGVYPTGNWVRERENQIRFITPQIVGFGGSYSATTDPPLDMYETEVIFISNFQQTTIGSSASLNINGLGDKAIKIVDGTTKRNVIGGEISTSMQYMVLYNSTFDQFEITNISSNGGYPIKWNIESTDNIIVPPYHEYFIYGDVNLDPGANFYVSPNAKVVQINGNQINNGNLVTDGTWEQVTLAILGQAGKTNKMVRWEDQGGPTSVLLSSDSSIYDDLTSVAITTSNLTIGAPNIISASSSNIVFWGSTFSLNNQFVYNRGAVDGYVLTTDSNGVASWTQNKFVWTGSVSAYTTYSITHNFGTTSLITNVWDETTGEQIMISVRNKTPNDLDIHSTVAVSNLKVVIMR